jgi:hypothetical protein
MIAVVPVDIVLRLVQLHIVRMVNVPPAAIKKVTIVVLALIVTITSVVRAAIALVAVPVCPAPPLDKDLANLWRADLAVVLARTDLVQLAPVRADPVLKNREEKGSPALKNQQLHQNLSARKYHHLSPLSQLLNRLLRLRSAISNCLLQLSSMVFAHALLKNWVYRKRP